MKHIINPFTVDSSNMLNIATGQAATATFNKGLEPVKKIGKTAFQKCLNDNSKKVQKVKLHTFQEVHSGQMQTILHKWK